jgi:hypothetical protein
MEHLSIFKHMHDGAMAAQTYYSIVLLGVEAYANRTCSRSKRSEPSPLQPNANTPWELYQKSA